MGRVELYPFRFRDPVTRRWVTARYRAEREEIERRYAEYEVIGPAEVRDGDPDEPRFTPHGARATDGARQDSIAAEFQPHLARPPAIDPTEIGLLKLFLRRYVTYCARRRRYASMNGAVRLIAELNGTLSAGTRG